MRSRTRLYKNSPRGRKERELYGKKLKWNLILMSLLYLALGIFC